jgi:hypothetical protein
MGNSEATSLSWEPLTNIPLSIKPAISIARSLPHYRPTFAVNPTQECYAMALNATLQHHGWLVQKLIGGQIFVSEGITAGTGLMMNQTSCQVRERCCIRLSG